jgi:hypothetical protein
MGEIFPLLSHFAPEVNHTGCLQPGCRASQLLTSNMGFLFSTEDRGIYFRTRALAVTS